MEWAAYAGHRYGTLRSELDDRLRAGTPVVLEIELQGARQLRETLPDAVRVFIAPPSESVLRDRLRERGTDDEAEVQARLEVARQELGAQSEFSHVVVNDSLERATDELQGIVRAGLQAMYGSEPEDVFYYLTLYNEPYLMPAMPDGVEEGITAGLYRYAAGPDGPTHRARILASGPAVLSALDAQTVLAEHYDVSAEVWSATSYKALREDALRTERWNRLHPAELPRVPYVSKMLDPEGARWWPSAISPRSSPTRWPAGWPRRT